MFENSFFRPPKNYKIKALVFPLSLAVHVAVGLLVIVIPLLHTGELPEVEIHNAFLAAPQPPSPPPPPPPPLRHGQSSRSTRIKPIQAQSHVEDGKLVAPVNIPDKIAEEPLSGMPGGVPGGIEGGVPDGILGGVIGKVLEGVVGPVEPPLRINGEIKPPRLLKEVLPVYPEIARLVRKEGVVIIEATTDIYGRVAACKVLRSEPLLDQAALDAVRQWLYEPMVINGKPRGVIFTVTVRFVLTKN